MATNNLNQNNMHPILGMLAGSGINAGMGMLTRGYDDRRQLEQQERLMRLQMEGQKELGTFNQGLAIDTWNKTNYEAQRRHMENAGLNVGLMYGGAGASGTTSGGSAGNVAGGNAPQGKPLDAGMGMQLGMQMALMNAQKENIEADTKLKETDATLKGGPQTKNIEASTRNTEANTVIADLTAKLQNVEVDIKNETQWDIVEGVRNANLESRERIDLLRTQNKITKETAEELINQMNNASIEQGLRISAQKLGLVKTGAEINAIKTGITKMTAEIQSIITQRQQSWTRLNYEERQTIVKETMAKLANEVTEFNTSTPQQIKQWTEIITQFIPMSPDASQPIGFKY